MDSYVLCVFAIDCSYERRRIEHHAGLDPNDANRLDSGCR